MTHPITIAPAALPSLPLDERAALPDTPAIYFVLAGDTVLYIGQSVNVRQRWVAHHRLAQLNEHGGCRIAWMTVDAAGLLGELERACIAHFEPVLNGTGFPGRAQMTVVFPEPQDMTRLEAVARRKRLPTSIMVRMWVMEQVEREERESGQEG